MNADKQERIDRLGAMSYWFAESTAAGLIVSSAGFTFAAIGELVDRVGLV